MKRNLLHSAPLAFCTLCAAARLVPAGERAPWLAEWTAELWHLARPRESSQRGAQDALAFSLGAWPDAWWLRWNQLSPIVLPLLRRGSGARCVLVLGAWAVLSLLAGLCLPGARHALLSVVSADTRGVVLISAAGYAGTESPTVSLADYREWTTDAGQLFSELAFYRPMAKRVHLARYPTVQLSLGVGSTSLLDVLNMRAAGRVQLSGGAQLWLSRSAWLRDYGGDPHLLEHSAIIAGRPVQIAGVIPDDNWPLSSRIDAWLLGEPDALQQLPPGAKGFVLARLRDAAPPVHAEWRALIVNENARSRRFDCIGLTEIVRQPLSIFLFGLLLACMALPATTALPLGDYPVHPGRLSGSVRLRRWSFLAVKFFLVLLIAWFCSTDLTYGFVALRPSTAVYVQLAVSFTSLLFAFRWILQDQRRRCPVCLCCLSNPARVGQASCNFLAWNGTELFCSRGHGFLHIPELSTSWFSRQRWLCLDPSWLPLFSETCPAPATFT